MPRLFLLLALAGCAADNEPLVRPDFDAAFAVLPGVETATVVGAEPDAALTLYDFPAEDPFAPRRRLTVVADSFGQAHFAYLPAEHAVLDSEEGFRIPVEDGEVLSPGLYMIRNEETGENSGTFEVLGVDDVPDPSLYDGQTLHGIHVPLLPGDDSPEPQEGFQYIEMRDGTLLSAMVRFPDPLIYGDGPYPTMVTYSGYSPSRPDSQDPGSRIANALGYATVGVNMRGSGCSGGVFDVFNRAQHADGYDIIETVARQDWVMHNHVGMIGLSYLGISQLYVASTNPPSLAGIVPLSTIADAWEMQWPGGIYNSGFTRSWIDNRDAQAARGGASWVLYQINDLGDETCAANTQLSAQNLDFETFFQALEFRPRNADDRDLNLLVEQIEAPVFHGGAWQDEQTGPLFGNLLDRYHASEHARALVYNGRHPDGYAPDAVSRIYEFMELYVAERVPVLNPAIRLFGADTFASSFNMEEYSFPEDRFADFGDDHAGALAAYQAEDPVTILFENGAGGPPGEPTAVFSTTAATWPSPDLEVQTWFTTADGLLTDEAPTDAAAHQWRFDPDAGSVTFLEHYDLMRLLWRTDWTHFAPGDLVTYTTEPFASPTVVAGPGQARLWLRTETDTSVQVTLTEVRPDGTEVYIQTAALRLLHRAYTETDDLRIRRSFDPADALDVPPGEWIEAVVPIPPFAHPVRAGSSIQLAVSAPGRDHATWEFEPVVPGDDPLVDVGIGGDHASSLVLTTDPTVEVPDGAPVCPSLRGQPCRDWVATVNVSVDP